MLKGCVLVLITATALVQAQSDTPVPATVRDLSIPVELTTTVRAETAQRGDAVEFRTIQPVLISSSLVMPANAKLKGRIVGAAPRQGDKPSWLVLLVERAEWKKESIPLHAFISRQIAVSSTALQNGQIPDAMTSTSSPRRRESARAAAHDGIDNSPSTRLPQDAREISQPDSIDKGPPLKDLRIVRDKDGIAYLFSATSNVKLPSGTLLVLQNQPIPGLAAPERNDAHAASPATQH